MDPSQLPASVLQTANNHGLPHLQTTPELLSPHTEIVSHDLRMTATGSEYFRIWIVNLLLILLTLGIYLPWAKVRKLKYFYTNTTLDQHALDFHAEPKKMLRGTIIMGIFFVVYSKAAGFDPIAGLVALSALLAVWPPLFRAAMQFRLTNTSWRGMRFQFVDKGLKEPYLCLVPPMALLLLPGALLGFASGSEQPAGKAVAKAGTILPDGFGLAMGLVFLLFVGLLPYFFWRLKRLQHNHYAWGPLKSEYRSTAMATYKVFGMTVAVVLLIVAVFIGIVFAFISPAMISDGKRGPGALMLLFTTAVPLLILFFICINILPRAYFNATMQNLLWSRTGNTYFRFKSKLNVWAFIRLQFKNYFLIMFTFGFYWPFAVVATKKMQVEAISLKSRIGLDDLNDLAQRRSTDAAGDVAADFFGLDVGM